MRKSATLLLLLVLLLAFCEPSLPTKNDRFVIRLVLVQADYRASAGFGTQQYWLLRFDDGRVIKLDVVNATDEVTQYFIGKYYDIYRSTESNCNPWKVKLSDNQK